MVYELTQSIVFFVLKILSYFLPMSFKMKKFLQFKEDDNFLLSLAYAKRKQNNKTVFWVHVSSAGELDLFIPIAEKLHEKFGAYFFLSYYSPSALPFVKNVPYLICHCGFPKDKKVLFMKAFKSLSIKKVFFVRYDIWPKFLEAAIASKVECSLVSATISKKASLFSKFRECLYFRAYRKLDNIFVVTKKDEQVFKKACPKSHVIFSGDSKWSRVVQKSLQTKDRISKKVKNLSIELDALRKKRSLKILIFASPHKDELEILRQVTALKGFFFMCVPQEVEKASLAKLRENYIDQSLRVEYSSSSTNLKETDLLLVDEVGFLSQLYAYCDLAIVGGGFSGKPHNLIEPAVGGSAILVGDKLSRAPEAALLREKNCLQAFQSQTKLMSYLKDLNKLIMLGEKEFLFKIKKDFISQDDRKAFFESLPRPEETIASFLK